MPQLILRHNYFFDALYWVREGLKIIFLSHWCLTPPLKVIKNNVFFLDTRPFFEHFFQKMYFSPLESPKHLEKFQKMAMAIH